MSKSPRKVWHIGEKAALFRAASSGRPDADVAREFGVKPARVASVRRKLERLDAPPVTHK